MSTTETELERTVREEQQAHDQAEIERRRENVTPDEDDQPGDGEQPAGDDPADGDAVDDDAVDDDANALFDAKPFEREELALPTVDGHGIDRISIKFAGEVMLDRSSPEDVALYRRLTYGKTLDLRIAGRVAATGAKGATNREGDLDVTIGTRSVKVDTVYVLDPEEL